MRLHRRHASSPKGTADTFLVIFSLLWSGIFLFFPLFNRDRLRIGDIVAGTWVVRTEKADLSFDLVGSAPAARRSFSDAALSLYGIYELRTLEEVLRGGQSDSIATVARVSHGEICPYATTCRFRSAGTAPRSEPSAA